MGVEFIQSTPAQSDQVRQMIDHLNSNPGRVPEIQVAPDRLETSPSEVEAASATNDALVELFRQKSHVPIETFLQQMEQQRQTLGTN